VVVFPWWYCRIVGTGDNQQAVDGENQRARWPTYALYRLDLKQEPEDKVAWIEKKKRIDHCFFTLRFRASRPLIPSSRPCISCNKQPAGVLLELAKLERRAPQSRQGTETNTSAEFFQRKNTEPESVGTAVVMYIRHKARCALYLLKLRSV
jgi:hypothetical protein